MLGVFFAQSFSSAVIKAYYHVNTAAYAKNCENKNKPWLHCNGKCQMHKQIQQENKKEQDNAAGKMSGRNEITLSSKSFFAKVQPSPVTGNKNQLVTPLSLGCLVDRHTDIFHPPQA